MTINLNDTVRVKLTDYGELIHVKTIGDCPEKDENGYVRYQLYDFMRIFGHFMIINGAKVIDPLDIEVWKK